MRDALQEQYREHNRTYEQIRRGGAIVNLNDTLEIITHDIATRLIAWPGNGFQTQSLHMLTLKPGQQTKEYQYATSEEALLCLRGAGQVFLHNQWVTIQPGDIAYFPEGVEHALRNPETNAQDCIFITQITPPVLELYIPSGFYNAQQCVMNFVAIEQAKKNVIPGTLNQEGQVRFNDTYPALRAWNMKPEEIRAKGALFNMYMGGTFGNLRLPMRLVLWPGYGTRLAGLHSGFEQVGTISLIHIHPISDEVLMLMGGVPGKYFCGDRWLEVEINDCLLAPCGVPHGATGPLTEPEDLSKQYPKSNPEIYCTGAGFASPPQMDLYIRSGCYQNGVYAQLPFIKLDLP